MALTLPASHICPLYTFLHAPHSTLCFTALFSPRSNKKIQIVGAHLEPEVPEEEPLHLGVFKPKAGIREKLRETLHEVLLVEMASRPTKDEGEDQSTLSPLSTVTISKNTR